MDVVTILMAWPWSHSRKVRQTLWSAFSAQWPVVFAWLSGFGGWPMLVKMLGQNLISLQSSLDSHDQTTQPLTSSQMALATLLKHSWLELCSLRRQYTWPMDNTTWSSRIFRLGFNLKAYWPLVPSLHSVSNQVTTSWGRLLHGWQNTCNFKEATILAITAFSTLATAQSPCRLKTSQQGYYSATCKHHHNVHLYVQHHTPVHWEGTTTV